MKDIKNNVVNENIDKSKKIRKPIKRKKIRVHSKTYYNVRVVILCLITIISVLVLGVVLSASILFKISEIDVIGESDYSYDEIVEASGIREGDNLFTVDIIKGQKNIESTFPYVDKVKIDRNIPNKVSINVETAVPKFTLEHEGKYIIISDSGKMFDIVESARSDLTELKGVELKSYNLCEKVEYSEPIVKEKIDEIIKNINENQLNVTKIDVSNLCDISIKYDDRIDVLLGMPDEIDYKILTAKEILCNKLSKEDRGQLDLSSLKSDGKSYFTPEYIMK